jgi:hypothetical protein
MILKKEIPEMMTDKPFVKVPTWKDGKWIERTIFQTREEFIAFLLPLFKEPGQYAFDETSHYFNEQARLWRKNGKVYCAAEEGTSAYNAYWDAERRKCRRGAIYINGTKTWYLPREYYMLLNFLPINDKAARQFNHPGVRDAQYHMALYETLAELHYLHVAILKKRQMLSSYYHAAKLICHVWHEETPILKMGASLADLVNNAGTWKFLEEYRSFLNKYTAWYRDFSPGGEMKWQQQAEVDHGNGKKTKEGLKGTIKGMSFENSNTKGVGGACTIFFYEEAGIAPTMDITYEFIRPALEEGGLTTGLFIAAGSVGELEHCEPLKEMILNPVDNEIYPTEHNLMDVDHTFGTTGLFIPEQWSMPPCMDEFGNSNVEEALDLILNTIRPDWKDKLSPERYRYRVSQHPINVEEAFGARKESKFPLHLVNAQKQRIRDNEYPSEFVDLVRKPDLSIEIKKSKKLPITDFPVKKKTLNKESVVIIYERPDKNAEWGTYLASIDPVSEGKTVTSDSLCSIYVYKNPVQVTTMTAEGPTSHIEHDKIVAAWCGRFDDLNKTHQLLEMIIELYGAWTIIENNISLFIQYMIAQRKQKYLVPKSMIGFLKELQANKNVHQDYGWKNTGTMFRSHMLNYLIEWLNEEIHVDTEEDGTITHITYGVERIPDMMALEEMSSYHDKLNVDRLVSLSALIAFAKMLQSNIGYRKRVDTEGDEELDKSKKMTKLNSSPFRHIGRGGKGGGGNKPRSPFKNIK